MAEARCHMSRRSAWALALVLAAALLAVPASSQAAFPGGNGKLAFTENSSAIWEVYEDGTGLKRLTETPSPAEDAYEPAWSPDGRRIAFTSTRDSTGTQFLDQEIYVMYADGSGLTRVTDNPAGDSVDPAWSPDGRRIAFSDHTDIYVANADGSGSPTNLTNDPLSDTDPAWSPDGRQIAFASQRDGAAGSDIYVMNAEGGGPLTRLTDGPESDGHPEWSPDGQQIAFASGIVNGTTVHIHVMNADGTGSPTPLTSGPHFDSEPAWSPDGGRIAFTRDDGIRELFVMDASGGVPTPVTNTPAVAESEPNWQPVTTTITVRNALWPSSAPARLDLSVDSTVVRSAAGDGDAGTTIVDQGVHVVGAAAGGGTSLAEYVTSIACTKNGNPDVSGRGTSIDVIVAPLDTVVCTVTSTAGEPTPAGLGVPANPLDTTTGTRPVRITFTEVTVAGVTALSTSSSGPPPLSFFELSGSYYHLETTAQFTSAEVCFPHAGPPVSILHWDGPFATELDTRVVGPDVCADVSSFSPFALARFVGGDDVDAPQVMCGSADGVWHAGNVSIDCTAQDTGSGLTDPDDATFALSTSVPPGTEDGDASTGSRQVCDVAGNCATAGPIGENRIDRRAPTLALPAAKTVDATSPQGAAVTFSASATDGVDPHPGVSCSPASGSVFTIGTRNVACTATDHVGNSAVGSFGVTVRGAMQQLDRLLQEVIAASRLPAAVKAQVLATLQAAVARFDPSKPAQRKAMCNTLTTFTVVVRLLSGRGIPQAQAAGWIADANRIRAVIGC